MSEMGEAGRKAYMENPEPKANELALNELNATDTIRLETKNHKYEFVVLDPAGKRGLLSGGSVGDNQREAILIGSMAKNTKGFDCDNQVVKMGDRVLFGIITDKEPESFFTTSIRSLSVVRGGDERRDKTATSNPSD